MVPSPQLILNSNPEALAERYRSSAKTRTLLEDTRRSIIRYANEMERGKFRCCGINRVEFEAVAPKMGYDEQVMIVNSMNEEKWLGEWKIIAMKRKFSERTERIWDVIGATLTFGLSRIGGTRRTYFVILEPDSTIKK